MKTYLLPLTTLCVALAGWLATPAPVATQVATQDATQDAAPPVVKVTDDDRADMQPRISDLDFLAGLWRGSDGSSDWESCYSTGAGGQLVGASKEMQGGRVAMIDFEHFYEKDGQLIMRPYPYGKPSVEFTLVSFDAKTQRAVFANEDHDFPKSFTYHRTGKNSLSITLQGDLGGEDAEFVLEFTRQDG